MIITSGLYKGRKIIAPSEKITRPTLSKMREGIFSTLFSLTDFEGKSFLDFFAGSGIMGLEAISRGFMSVVAIEKNPVVARILKQNYKNLGVEQRIIVNDSLRAGKKLSEKFDVIYIDPPYASGMYEQVLELIRDFSILNDTGIVVLEHTEDINWDVIGYKLIKQKQYSQKYATFLTIEK